MATLPTVTYYWRQSGAADDAWTEDADGAITPTAGQTIEVVSVGASRPAFRAADTTPTVTGVTAISLDAGATLTPYTPTYGGTNRVYAISGPLWLSIDSSGEITGTAPATPETGTYTVTVTNAAGSASATANVTVAAASAAPGPILTIDGTNQTILTIGGTEDTILYVEAA